MSENRKILVRYVTPPNFTMGIKMYILNLGHVGDPIKHETEEAHAKNSNDK